MVAPHELEQHRSALTGHYRTTGPWALIVLELRGDRIAALNYFLDADTLFPRFGLTLARPA